MRKTRKPQENLIMKQPLSMLSLYMTLARRTPDTITLHRPLGEIQERAEQVWFVLVDLDKQQRVRDRVKNKQQHWVYRDH